ncbi:MAG: oligosaccharide flippase family protein [Acidobacteria bacterium]|nr:oligosaccharide flippase family protein [Acidobacteriota bacterium]
MSAIKPKPREPELSVGASPKERSQAARGGLVSLAGAATSSVMGFALTFILARTLGAVGSGVVLQTIAIFTIVLGIAKTGMDTAAVWILPRLAISDKSQIRGVVTAMLVPVTVVATGMAVALNLVTPLLFSHSTQAGDELVQAVRAASWFLPAASLTMVALAATRGIGNIVPYTVIGSIFMPALRPVLVLGVIAFGGAAVAASLAWAVPAGLAMVAALAVLYRRVKIMESSLTEGGRYWPPRAVNVELWKFTLPRWFSSGVEQSIIWIDVVLVGIIAGAGAAGIYGAASRFVSAGLIISTAMRMVISPRFSALLGQNRIKEVQNLYTTTVCWIVLLGTPIYAIFAIFAPTVLSWLGAGFESGNVALIILCCGAVTFLLAGNVDSLLMMSGRSGWMAANKVVVLALNIVGNLVLIPLWGIAGAAASWAFSLFLDSALASIESTIFLHVRFEASKVLYSLFVGACSVLPVGLLMVQLMGQNWHFLVTTCAAGGLILLGWCLLDKKRLHLDGLSIFTRKSVHA